MTGNWTADHWPFANQELTEMDAVLVDAPDYVCGPGEAAGRRVVAPIAVASRVPTTGEWATIGGKRKRCVTVVVTAVHDTEKAVLVQCEAYGEHWIARSQIADESEVRASGDFGRLVFSEWLSEQIGWPEAETPD